MQKPRECSPSGFPRLLLLTDAAGTQGRRHPVVIVTEAASALRSTAHDRRPSEPFLVRIQSLLECPERKNKTASTLTLPKPGLGPSRRKSWGVEEMEIGREMDTERSKKINKIEEKGRKERKK